MSDTPENQPATTNDDAATQGQPQPRFSMKGQYIKDLSLENPHAPGSLMGLKEQPRVDLNLDLQAQKIQDNLYELVLVFNVQTSSDKVLFVLELKYAGIFELVNIPDNLVERVLLVDSAFTLFPFARRVISDITRDGGFPPLLLEPIDFMGLYEKRKQQEAATQQTANGDAAAVN